MVSVPVERVNVGGKIIQHAGFRVPAELRAKLADFNPRSQLGDLAREVVRYLPADLACELIDHVSRTIVVESQIHAVVIRGCPEHGPDVARCLQARCVPRVRENWGIVSRKVVTTAGVNKIVALLNQSDATTATTLKYHGIGTGSTAEAIGDTALVTELTSEYNPDSTRATGSQTTGGSSNIYRTVGTNTLDSGTPALREHGVFSAASAGTLLDRSVFAAINLTGANGDGLQVTYDLTVAAGG